MPNPNVLLVPSVTTLTVPEINGLNIPAAKPIQSMVNAIPDNDLVYEQQQYGRKISQICNDQDFLKAIAIGEGAGYYRYNIRNQQKEALYDTQLRFGVAQMCHIYTKSHIIYHSKLYVRGFL